MTSTQITQAKTEAITLTTDARPEEQYAALVVFAGHQAPGWLPAHEVSDDDVAEMLARVEETAAEHGVWVGWGEPYIDGVEYASGETQAIIARPCGTGS